MNSRRGLGLAFSLTTALLGMAALLAVAAPSALAVKTHLYTGTSFGPDGTAGSASFESVQGVAVDQANGDVYVLDAGEGGQLYKFDSLGVSA